MPKKGKKSRSSLKKKSTRRAVDEEFSDNEFSQVRDETCASLPRRSIRIAERERSPDWRAAGDCDRLTYDEELVREVPTFPRNNSCNGGDQSPYRFLDRSPFERLPTANGDNHVPGDNPSRRDGTRTPGDTHVTVTDIASLTAALIATINGGKQRHKLPTYKGEGDVSMYIDHFKEVAVANRWNEMDTLINLRSALEGPARDCGGAPNVEAIYDALKTRFGIAPRQARERLRNLKKSHRATLSEFAVEVERLVNIAYSSASAIEKLDMAVDSFIRGMEPKSLQVFLLARRPTTMKEAVTAVEEYTQLGPSSDRPRAHEVWVDSQPRVNTAVTQINNDNEVTQLLRQILNKLNVQGNSVSRVNSRIRQNDESQVRPCFNCGGPHMRKFCPRQNNSNFSKPTAQAVGRNSPRPVNSNNDGHNYQKSGNGRGPSRH